MVNGLGPDSPCTPEELVTCWSVMTPEIGSFDVDDAGGMVFVDAEKMELLGGSFEIGGSVGLGGLGLFESAFGDGSFVVKKLGAIELDAGQALIVLGLDVNLVGAGNVGALDAEQDLSFLDGIAELGFDFDDAAGGERNDGNGANNIRLDDSGDVEGGDGQVRDGGGERELVGVIDFEVVGVEIGLDLGFGRSFLLRVGFAGTAGGKGQGKGAAECER